MERKSEQNAFNVDKILLFEELKCKIQQRGGLLRPSLSANVVVY